jgi:predicted Zn-dependent protease
LLDVLLWALDARQADEGRSAFSDVLSGREHDLLFPKTITLSSDPSDKRIPATPWDAQGLPQTRQVWIQQGKLAALSCDRYWAKQRGRAPVPAPSNAMVEGGAETLASLIAGTERGVLVTSLWYIRQVDPRSLLLTGLTRDGVFWIENGKVQHPVNNFRWNDSPISVLRNTLAASRAERAAPRGGGARPLLVPALKVGEFNFSSVSDAV